MRYGEANRQGWVRENKFARRGFSAGKPAEYFLQAKKIATRWLKYQGCPIYRCPTVVHIGIAESSDRYGTRIYAGVQIAEGMYQIGINNKGCHVFKSGSFIAIQF
jgi:hypothetical protein